jgi:hypothetical protein
LPIITTPRIEPAAKGPNLAHRGGGLGVQDSGATQVSIAEVHLEEPGRILNRTDKATVGWAVHVEARKER